MFPLPLWGEGSVDDVVEVLVELLQVVSDDHIFQVRNGRAQGVELPLVARVGRSQDGALGIVGRVLQDVGVQRVERHVFLQLIVIGFKGTHSAISLGVPALGNQIEVGVSFQSAASVSPQARSEVQSFKVNCLLFKLVEVDLF